MLRTKELESKLELEHATRSRLEVQCNRHKESLEKTQTELIHIRSKETLLQEELKKIKKTLRYVSYVSDIHPKTFPIISSNFKGKQKMNYMRCRIVTRIISTNGRKHQRNLKLPNLNWLVFEMICDWLCNASLICNRQWKMEIMKMIHLKGKNS